MGEAKRLDLSDRELLDLSDRELLNLSDAATKAGKKELASALHAVIERRYTGEKV